MDQIQSESTVAPRDMKEYTFAQKNEFIEEKQIELAEINRELDRLSAKIETSSEAIKAESKNSRRCATRRVT